MVEPKYLEKYQAASAAMLFFKVLSFHRLRYKQMLMLEKSWFYNRTSFFVYSWTNGVPVL